MKILDDIWSSIIGNTKTRVSDPFVGAFVISWVICNWNHLALLFWGEGTNTNRINGFHRYLSETEPFAFNSLLVEPTLLSAAYLLVLPWLSLAVKNLQKFANNKLHQQTIDVELNQAAQQEKLNKAKLRSNPDKQFLEQSVQLEIDRRKEILEQTKLRTIRFTQKAEEAVAKAAEEKNKASILQLDKESRENHFELERLRFAVTSAKVRANLASHRFPSIYLFMSLLEESLNEDEIRLSLSAISRVVAGIFGYQDSKSLIEDEKFNNDTLSNVDYIYFDLDELAKTLEAIASDESSKNPALTAELLYNHVRSVFEGLPYKLVTFEELEEASIEFCENNKFEILNHDSLSGPMAESDTIFEEIQIDDAESINFDDGFSARISAIASGHHRKEHDVTGQDLSISVCVKSHVLVGKNALGPLELGDISASLIYDYAEDED